MQHARRRGVGPQRCRSPGVGEPDRRIIEIRHFVEAMQAQEEFCRQISLIRGDQANIRNGTFRWERCSMGRLRYPSGNLTGRSSRTTTSSANCRRPATTSHGPIAVNAHQVVQFDGNWREVAFCERLGSATLGSVGAPVRPLPVVSQRCWG